MMKKNLPLSKLIGSRELYRITLSLALPIIIQNTVTNVVSLLDNVMVGHVGTLPMSAVAIVGQILFVYNLCIFGGLSGAGIFSAQYAGAKDNEGLRACLRIKFWILGIVFCIAMLILTLAPGLLISSYIAEGTNPADAEETTRLAFSYLRVMLWGLLPFGISQVFAGTLRENGEARVPMLASIAAILINLIFNALLIFGLLGFPKLGVVGAAIATVLSRFVEMGIILVYIRKSRTRFPFFSGVFSPVRFPKGLIRRVIVQGSPLLFNEFFWSAGIALLLQCYSVRGLPVVAAANIASTATNLFNTMFLSMGIAAGIVIGQMLGAGETEKARSSCWQLAALSVTVSLIMGILLLLFARLIPLAFNTSTEVRDLACGMLRTSACIMPAAAFANCCYFVLRSGGQTMITLAFDSVYSCCFVYPVAWLLAYKTSLPILPLYAVVQSLEFIKCVLGYVLLKQGRWIRSIVEMDS